MKNNVSVVPVLLRKSRALSANLVSAFYRMWKIRALKRRDVCFNHMKNLSVIYFKLTGSCNLRCVMCGQYGEKGVMHGRMSEEAKKIMPLKSWKKVVDDITSTRPIIYLWGGEPFLYPDLFPLARYITEKGLYLSINTNGTLMEKHAEQIVRDKWSTIFVSLDAFRETNDAQRGIGSYDKAIAGIKAVAREKKKQGSSLPVIGIVTVVTNRNYLDLANLSDAIDELGVDLHIINMGTYTNDAIVAAQRAVMRDKLDTDIDCLEGYNTGYNLGIDAQKFHAILEDIKSKKRRHTTIAAPRLNPEKVEVYYNDLETPVRDRCIVPWCQANINYNGDVHFCADYPDYILGNVAENSFKDIYNGERANKFRKEIGAFDRGMFPGCLRCYQNMLFGNKIKGF